MPDDMHEIVAGLRGKMDACVTSGCGWRCCKRTGQTGGLAIFPGEFDHVPAERRAHLEVKNPDFHGGMRVVCHAKNTATCDGGYTPIDCRLYPLWPLPTKDGAAWEWTAHVIPPGTYSRKLCPLKAIKTWDHRVILTPWVDRLMQIKEARAFLRTAVKYGTNLGSMHLDALAEVPGTGQT